MLSKFVHGIKRENMAHVSRALFCPCLACKGVIKVHANNGTFVAVAEEGAVLYARCSDWTCHCERADFEGSCVEVVEGSGTRPWIKLTLATLEALEEGAQHPRKRQRT